MAKTKRSETKASGAKRTDKDKPSKAKTGIVHARVNEKLRYGLELAAQDQGISLSQALERAVIAYLDLTGISRKTEGQRFSLLDTLWDKSPARRLMLAAQHMIASGYPVTGRPALLAWEDFLTGCAISDIVKGFEECASLWSVIDGNLALIRQIANAPTISGDEWNKNIAELAKSLGVTRNAQE